MSGTLGEKQSKLPSALCSQMDVPGTFNIEDDYYFNQRKMLKDIVDWQVKCELMLKKISLQHNLESKVF